jgi:hypothetical protein
MHVVPYVWRVGMSAYFRDLPRLQNGQCMCMYMYNMYIIVGGCAMV